MTAEADIAIEGWFAHPPQALFDAWTRPERLAQWFAADGWVVAEARFIPQEGEPWRVDFLGAGGARYAESGVVLTVERPRRLRFTLAQHGLAAPAVETLVEVTFEAVGGGTRMHFRQSGLNDPTRRGVNDAGWRGCFQRLEASLSTAP